MSAYRETLHRLARQAGIVPNWRDCRGVAHEVSIETLAALLGAMGLPAQSEPAARTTLRECLRNRTGLAAASVVDAGARLVVLPKALGARDWVLELESGERHEGKLASAAGSLSLPVALPEGYHHLRFVDGEACGTHLIAAPTQCHLPPSQNGWGIAVQLYSLRSDRQWGMGDLTDLAILSAEVAAVGGALVGINPLHALFPAVPDRISPYSPSSRRFLNPLYLDVTALPDVAECTEFAAWISGDAFRSDLASAAAAPLVEYEVVARLKTTAFAMLWRSFRTRHLGPKQSDRGRSFRHFQAAGGQALVDFALFHTLQTHFAATHGPAWCHWPPGFRDSGQREARQFAADHYDEIERHQYLQWEAERQLAVAGTGLPIGLYRDLAVGVDPYGADCWSAPDPYLTGASIGAPPDLLNGSGQNWGLTGFSPAAFKAEGYGAFIATLRANMRHAGGLRIDHVMGLKQLYLIPEGMSPIEGAYLRYPFHDLVRILALESRRQRCVIVGEDLGTVPRGFRPVMSRAGILSCRVLPFECRRDGRFKPPCAYPVLAAASAGTHDLPPLKAWWLGADIQLRDRVGHYAAVGARESDERLRDRDRRSLLAALCRQNLLSATASATLLPPCGSPVFDPALVEAVHRYLLLTPARLVLFQAEDLLGCEAMANLPGTTDEHANWRSRLPASVPMPAVRRE